MAQDKHWLVRPQTIGWLWLAFIVILALTIIAELLVHLHGSLASTKHWRFTPGPALSPVSR